MENDIQDQSPNDLVPKEIVDEAPEDTSFDISDDGDSDDDAYADSEGEENYSMYNLALSKDMNPYEIED